MKQREDTIRKRFSLWLDSREAELSGEAPTGFDGLSLIRWSADGKIAFIQEYACTEKRYCPYG